MNKMEYSGAISGQYYAHNTNYLNSLNYLPYHTPPHNSPAYSYNWSEILKPPPSPTDEACHYQHMRFPTPPITPPRSQGYNKKDFIDLSSVKSKTRVDPEPVAEPEAVAEPLKVIEENRKAVSKSIRTQSVIMKVSQGQNLEHVSLANDPCTTTEDSQTMNHLINISGSDSSSPTNDFICAWQDCERFFESLESLAQHVTQIHAVANIEDGLYYCRWHGCQRSDRGFNARYKMLVHVRTHTKEKPHKCHLCEKSFSRAENLKIHIRSHSGEKPYKCTYEGCNKAYSNSSDRFKHTRTHTMEKPYKCKVPGCQKRYTDPSSLRKHVKTFKHSIQIMDNNHLPNQVSNQTEASSIPTDSISAHKQEASFNKESSALGLSHLPYNPVKNYHIPSVVHDVEDEDHDMVIDQMPLTQLYDRNTSQIHSSFYWLPEKSLVKSYPSFYNDTYYPLHHHHGQTYPLEMDLDRPLDLTVHKVQ